jgi:hypothetical protein
VSVARVLAFLTLLLPSVADASQQGWQIASPLPEPRRFHLAGVDKDGCLYVYGGYVIGEDGTERYGLGEHSLVVLDPRTNRWARGPALAPPQYKTLGQLRKSWFDKGQLREEIVIEEETSTTKLSHEVPTGRADPLGRPQWPGGWLWVPFEPDRGSWGSPAVALKVPSSEPGVPPWEWPWKTSGPEWSRYTPTLATSSNGVVYITGGLARPFRKSAARPTLQSSIEIWDSRTNSWKTLPSMRLARYLHAAAIDTKGRLFVFGGSAAEPSTTQEDTESAESFRRRAADNRARADTSLSSVEMYDPETNGWSERAPLPTPRQAMGADLGADGRIYVVGGAPSYSHPRPMAVVEIYDPETDTWETGPSMNYARRGHAVVATPDGKIFAIGGFVGRRQRTLREQVAGDFVDPALGATVEVLDTRPGQ